jgi:predicted methyltransferase
MRVVVMLFLVACGGGSTAQKPVDKPVETPEPEMDAIAAAVGAADRDEADRALDEGRKPAELLAFIGVKPGMKVADLFAGGGYTTELLARVVGDSGQVYGQNPPVIYTIPPGKAWVARLEKPVMANVVRVDREVVDPLPPEATGLDAVIFVLTYHDAAHLGVDRMAMNKAVLAALRPGGVFVVVDHSAREGAGIDDAKTLHRIEEKVVREEVVAAGFALAGSGEFLRNPEDPRDWNASPVAAGDKRGHSDRFVLKFVKPAR